MHCECRELPGRFQATLGDRVGEVVGDNLIQPGSHGKHLPILPQARVQVKVWLLVMVGSTAGVYGEAGHSDYAAAKGAITSGLLLSLKNDVSEIGGVRVNAVAPGWTITPKKVEQGIDDSLVGRATATMSLKKLATPEDVAMAVVALSSDVISGHVSGQVIEVAGGMEGRLIP